MTIANRKVVAMIISRLTSSRLPRKQLRLINNIPLMQHIIERLRPISSIDQIVLATGPATENQDLADFSAELGVETYFDEDVDDVTGRIARAAIYFDADLVITISGDCPLVDASFLTRGIEILRSNSADYVYVDKTKYECLHEGLGFHTAETWQRLDHLSTTWSHREHAGSVILESIDQFKGAEIIPLPKFRRTDIRISVDTPADLKFMNQLYSITATTGTGLDLGDVVERIDEDKDLLKINQHVHQKGMFEKSQHYIIVTYASKRIGLGHLSRMLVLARELKEAHSAKITFLINKDISCQAKIIAADFKFTEWNDVAGLKDELESLSQSGGIDGIVIDIKQEDLHLEFGFVATLDIPLTVIDVLPDAEFDKSLTIIPSFPEYVNITPGKANNVYIGLDYLMLNRDIFQANEQFLKSETIVVTAGGSGTIPSALIIFLSELITDDKFIFIIGPYGDKETLEKKVKESGIKDSEILQNPQNIHELFARCKLAFSIYGITSLELMAMGIPQCIYQTISDNDSKIVKHLAQAGACIDLKELSNVSNQANVQAILKSDRDLAAMGLSGKRFIDGSGTSRVAELIVDHTNTLKLDG